jgi:hypothetical protein
MPVAQEYIFGVILSNKKILNCFGENYRRERTARNIALPSLNVIDIQKM